MPTFSVGNVHTNVPLTNLARQYRPLDEGFVAEDIAPRLPVANETNVYYTWDQGSFYGTEVSDLVADRTSAGELDSSATTDSYTCQRRELAWTISTRERNNADNQLRLEQSKQNLVLGRLQLLRELRIAALLNTTSTTTTVAGETITGGLDSTMTASASAAWDTTSTTYQAVLKDIVLGIRAMRQKIGIRPNVIVIPAVVAEGMHFSLVFSSSGGPQAVYSGGPEGVPYFQNYPLLPPTLAGCRVLVPGNIKNTAKEGQTASFSDVWGKQVTLLYVTPGPAMDTPSCAYTFTAEPRTTRQMRDEERRIDKFMVGETISEKVVAPFAGYTITSVVA